MPFPNPAMKSLCHPLISQTITKIIYEKSYNTTNVELDFPIRSSQEKAKKLDKSSFVRYTESMYILQLFQISVPNLNIKFCLQLTPKALTDAKTVILRNFTHLTPKLNSMQH